MRASRSPGFALQFWQQAARKDNHGKEETGTNTVSRTKYASHNRPPPTDGAGHSREQY